jgi:ATP-binding cassette subfamily B protein
MKSQLSGSSIKLFFHFLSYRKVKVISYVLVCALAGAIPSIDSILLQKIIDLIESSSNYEIIGIPSTMVFWALVYALWWESLNIWWRVYDYLFMTTFPFIKGKIIDELYNFTQHHSHKFFQSNLAGHITNRITEGARSFEMVFAILAEKIVRKIAVIIFALITLYVVHTTFATIFLAWLTVFIGISLYFSSTINTYSRIYARNKANVAGKIVDAIANINAVRIFTSHKFERKYLEHNLDTMVKSDQAMQWFMFKLRYVLGTSCTVMIFTMLYYLFRLRTSSVISIGDCVLIVTLCLAVVDDIWDLTQEIGDMFEELGTFNQSITLIIPHEIVDAKNAEKLIISQGTIEFRNVTFRYQHNNNIFNNKSVIIPGKQKVGLVGYSGSGKSTFVSLITRLYEIEGGSILIDEQDISKVTQDSLRENISIIPQEPILFHRTIMENIRYGKKNATDEEVIEAAKLAHIHEFVTELPDGYNTLCGERGNNLSGGQRQRVVIARAILKNAPILILDEATSSLDTNTETLIQESLKYLMQNKTVLVIAHRLSTLLNMDRIIVFDKGAIIEDGTHDELLKNCKLYKKLWRSQIKGIIAENP